MFILPMIYLGKNMCILCISSYMEKHISRNMGQHVWKVTIKKKKCHLSFNPRVLPLVNVTDLSCPYRQMPDSQWQTVLTNVCDQVATEWLMISCTQKNCSLYWSKLSHQRDSLHQKVPGLVNRGRQTIIRAQSCDSGGQGWILCNIYEIQHCWVVFQWQ